VVGDMSPAEFMRSQQPEVESYVRAFHRGERSAAREREV
jgi:hypothetical protein